MSLTVVIWTCEKCGSKIRLGKFVISTGEDINVQVPRCPIGECGGQMVCAIEGVEEIA